MPFLFNEFRILANDEAFFILLSMNHLFSTLCISVNLIPPGATPSGDYVFIKKGGPDSGYYSEVIGKSMKINLKELTYCNFRTTNHYA